MANGSEPSIPQEMPNAAAENAAAKEFESRIARLEERLEKNELSQEGQARELLISEIRQRIKNREIAVAIAVVVMIFMAGVLAHATHSFYWGKLIVVPQSVAIAFFIAPIISITTLAVVLIVGAFRRFKDEDMSNASAGSLAAEAARTSMG